MQSFILVSYKNYCYFSLHIISGKCQFSNWIIWAFIVQLSKISRLNLMGVFLSNSRWCSCWCNVCETTWYGRDTSWPLDSFSLHTAGNQTLHWFSKCFHNQILGFFGSSMKALVWREQCGSQKGLNVELCVWDPKVSSSSNISFKGRHIYSET